MIFREEDFIPINFPFSSFSWAVEQQKASIGKQKDF